MTGKVILRSIIQAAELMKLYRVLEKQRQQYCASLEKATEYTPRTLLIISEKKR
jgi:hypothetical protein